MDSIENTSEKKKRGRPKIIQIESKTHTFDRGESSITRPTPIQVRTLQDAGTNTLRKVSP